MVPLQGENVVLKMTERGFLSLWSDVCTVALWARRTAPCVGNQEPENL